MTDYRVQYSRGDDHRWHACVKGLPDFEAKGISLHNLRARVRQELRGAGLEESYSLPSKEAQLAARRAKAARKRLQKAQDEAAAASREAVALLTDLGLSHRDAALFLDLSYQRVTQLAADVRDGKIRTESKGS